MIVNYFKRARHKKINRKLLIQLLKNIDISDSDKKEFLSGIKILNWDKVEQLYNKILSFVKKRELKNIDEIEKVNFTKITWMTLHEAEKKKTEINSISFLFDKI